MNAFGPAVALFAATFVSEDLACISAGLLIQHAELGVTQGILACTVGIFSGDVALWAVGRAFGNVALRWPWVANAQSLTDLRRWLDRHAAGAIVGSRFLPGTRLPLYVLAGVVGVPGSVFALWCLIASVLWTPTIVLLTATLGDAFVGSIAPALGLGWPSRIAVAGFAWLVLRAARLLGSPTARTRLSARLARWRRWEFWPMWLFYAPVVAWIVWLAVRFRGIATMTAANPGMADGGTVGESKSDILRTLPADAVIPFLKLPPDELRQRLELLRAHIARAGWSFPLVLKPDVGQRGVGVRLVADAEAAGSYLSHYRGTVLAQPYHPGPYEAGVFYYRMPGWQRGRILSITDKHFPFIVGDGVSTLEELIWRHPRVRLQADVFLARFDGQRGRVLDRGERMQLAIAGNHAQGTLFRDGRQLWTAALEARIDTISRACNGFFVGRFDVRYTDVEAFMAGRDLAIVELNGATAESTSIYDPGTTLWSAYRQLFRQWWIVFAIGAANRRGGARMTSIGRLGSLLREHLSSSVS